MDGNEEIQELKTEVLELKYQIIAIKSDLDMRSIPEWAKEAVEYAQKRA